MIEGTGLGLHCPAIEDEENSYSQRDYESIEEKCQCYCKINHKPLNKVCHFLGLFASQLTKHCISFTAKETISRHNERSEFATLSKARSNIFPFLFLMRGQHLHSRIPWIDRFWHL